MDQFALNTRNVISLLKTERTLKLIQLNQEIKDNKVKVDYKESQLDNRGSLPIPKMFQCTASDDRFLASDPWGQCLPIVMIAWMGGLLGFPD